MAESESVPFWWIVLFLVLALGGGAITVWALGGSLVSAAIALPLLL
ncbi:MULTISPECIES: hypothetical protein [Haloferax]|nr:MULTISPECIES: hypothetical protein [Haloferax]